MAAAAALATAVSLSAAAESFAGEVAVGVTSGSAPELVRFDTDTPGTPLARVPIPGLVAGEYITGLDQRPATGELFAHTSFNRLLVIDAETGAARQLGTTLDGALFSLGVPSVGLDFNPAADRLRAVSSADDNVRINPITYAIVAPGDTDVAYLGGDPNNGDDPVVVASAYDRNDLDPATATTLFGIDSGQDVLVRQGAVDGNALDAPGGGSPNTGGLTTLGPLGADVVDADLDIVRGANPGGNVAYTAYRAPAATATTLGTVNLTTGAITPIGTIGASTLNGLTILRPGAIRVATTFTPASEAAAQVVVSVERTGDTLAPTSLAYATVDRTAIGGRDYTPVSGTLTFADGQRSVEVTIPILPDGDVEGTEAFALELGRPTGAVRSTSVHTIEVVDDDQAAAPAPGGGAGTPVTGAPVDRNAPAFLAAPSAPETLAALRKSKRLKLDFACSEGCAATFTLRLGRTELGKVLGTLPGAGVKTVTLRLTKAGLKALTRAARSRSRSRVSLVLAGTATDGAGNEVKRNTTLKLARR